jgi:hypothetical protein
MIADFLLEILQLRNAVHIEQSRVNNFIGDFQTFGDGDESGKGSVTLVAESGVTLESLI